MTLENICLSGGAEGADLQWGMVAGHAGHMVVHWGFSGHRSRAPKGEVVHLSDDQLDEADEPCKAASKTLKKWFPPKSQFVKNLLRRNWFQVKDAERVYAVSKFGEDGNVSGGTSWATQMFIDRFNGEACECYLFDQDTEAWYKWNGLGKVRWLHLPDGPPVPHGVWAGIGSRELTAAGKAAIRSLFGYLAAREDGSVNDAATGA